MNRILAALAVACALAVSACVPKDGSPGTSSQGWHQIPVGVGQVIGQTKADPKVEKTMAQVYAYCPELRIAAAGATLFSPQSVQKAAEIAGSLVRTACDAPPPRTVAEAIALTGVVVEAILVVRQAQKTPGA